MPHEMYCRKGTLDRVSRMESLLATSTDVFAHGYSGSKSDIRVALGQLTDSELATLETYLKHRRQGPQPIPEVVSTFQGVLEEVRREVTPTSNLDSTT